MDTKMEGVVVVVMVWQTRPLSLSVSSSRHLSALLTIPYTHTHTHTPAAHKQVTSNTNVHNISIDGKSGLVEISGPSPGSVQAAREEMDVKQEDVELSKDEAVAMLRDYR